MAARSSRRSLLAGLLSGLSAWVLGPLLGFKKDEERYLYKLVEIDLFGGERIEGVTQFDLLSRDGVRLDVEPIYWTFSDKRVGWRIVGR